MNALLESDREAVLRRGSADIQRLSTSVDFILQAYRDKGAPTAILTAKLEELRNKRDSVVTKQRALEHHRRSGWSSARLALDQAWRDLHDAWRTALAAIDKSGGFR